MNDSNEPKKGEIIPFGKFKGQPIEALAKNKDYTDWLVAQPWFRERYGNLYAIIINNFCEPSETPEHNALQARFLDDDFRLQFAASVFPRLCWYGQANGEMMQELVEKAVTEVRAALTVRDKENAAMMESYARSKAAFDQSASAGSALSKIIQPPEEPRPFKTTITGKGTGRSGELIITTPPSFEVNGVDCKFYARAGASFRINKSQKANGNREASSIEVCSHSIGFEKPLRIEIKPEVGDDYPAILRQMRRNESEILFTRSYIGIGVDLPTFIRFMESQRIVVIFESEVDNSENISVDIFPQNDFYNRVFSKLSEAEKS